MPDHITFLLSAESVVLKEYMEIYSGTSNASSGNSCSQQSKSVERETGDIAEGM